MQGDLDLDGDNDYFDFKYFKSAYTLVNGAAAFVALSAVPEPSALVMMLAIAGCVSLRIWRIKNIPRFSSETTTAIQVELRRETIPKGLRHPAQGWRQRRLPWVTSSNSEINPERVAATGRQLAATLSGLMCCLHLCSPRVGRVATNPGLDAEIPSGLFDPNPTHKPSFNSPMRPMISRSFISICAAITFLVCGSLASAAEFQAKFPSAPLIANDPYFSVWSSGPKLTDIDTTHWTGKPHRLTSLVMIDGKPFRLLGAEPSATPALEQTSLTITPTQSKFAFAGQGIEIELAFLTPAIPYDIDLLSRPITYLTYTLKATDGRQHAVKLLVTASAELTVNVPEQPVTATVEKMGDLVALKLGSREQPVLETKGDDLRIDWGYLYLAAPADASTSFANTNPNQPCAADQAEGMLPATSETAAARADELSARFCSTCRKLPPSP